MSMNRRMARRSFPLGVTLVDLLAAISAMIILIALAGSVTSRATELSRRRLCALNLKSIGTTCQIYANENLSSWPVPAFKEGGQGNPNIKYVNTSGTTGINPPEGEVGSFRNRPSVPNTTFHPTGGSLAVSVTRAFWMLIRSDDLDVEQFFCPSSADSPDPTVDFDTYYDFLKYSNISYGYQVPFGPIDTRPRNVADSRNVFAADKGPFYVDAGNPTWRQAGGEMLELESAPRLWQRYNSPNHGGRGNGEGQNCLFADIHVSFERKPTAGVDNDNIYTVMEIDWQFYPYNVIHGDTPHESNPPDPYPGQRALGSVESLYSSTDSLIYP